MVHGVTAGQSSEVDASAGASSLRRSRGWSSRCGSTPRDDRSYARAGTRTGLAQHVDREVRPGRVSDELVEQRILEAYAGAGPRAVVTGWAGLRLLGGGYFDGLASDGVTRLPVPIATNGRTARAAPGCPR